MNSSRSWREGSAIVIEMRVEFALSLTTYLELLYIYRLSCYRSVAERPQHYCKDATTALSYGTGDDQQIYSTTNYSKEIHSLQLNC